MALNVNVKVCFLGGGAPWEGALLSSPHSSPRWPGTEGTQGKGHRQGREPAQARAGRLRLPSPLPTFRKVLNYSAERSCGQSEAALACQGASQARGLQVVSQGCCGRPQNKHSLWDPQEARGQRGMQGELGLLAPCKHAGRDRQQGCNHTRQPCAHLPDALLSQQVLPRQCKGQQDPDHCSEYQARQSGRGPPTCPPPPDPQGRSVPVPPLLCTL